ncbi:MAG: hypothetical protein EXR14_00625 [Pelagibacteraceae bacterium]|nr:hypothetical protein [Pelagibacteraceae bacterium]PHX89444.1 MAG: hypothetical protein CK535_01710 [Pelagibacteraceae bacterium]
MIKYFLYISLSLLAFTLSFAKDVDVQENIKLSFACDLEKKILKNSEYNYETFLAKDLNNKNLDKFEIDAKLPDILLINGLSLFISNTEKLEIKILNKDIVFFKATDKVKNYSESGIIDRKTGELIHEITQYLKNDDFEKDISFYLCRKNENQI